MKPLLAALVSAVLHVSTRGRHRVLRRPAPSVTPEPGRVPGAPPLNEWRLSRGLLLLFVIVATLTTSQRPAEATGLPNVSVAPATATAGIGADIALDVDASNVSLPGLGGYVIVLQWNPAVLTLTSLIDSGWVPSGQVIVICTTPIIDNTNGTAELDCTPLFGYGDGVTTSGPQALAHAVFQAKASGTSTIDLTGSSLVDPSSIEIASTLTNGSVTVPGSVGGIAQSPDVAALPSAVSPGREYTRYILGGALALMVTAVGAVGWRRWSTSTRF